MTPEEFTQKMMKTLESDFRRFMLVAVCADGIRKSNVNIESVRAVHAAGFAAGMEFSQSMKKGNP